MVLILVDALHHHRMVDAWKSPLTTTKIENEDALRSLGASLITEKRGDEDVKWAVPLSGAVHRAPYGPEADEFLLAKFCALKKCAPNRLITHGRKHPPRTRI